MDSKTSNVFNNLMIQVTKVFAHARQGSYKTRERYKAAVIRFIAFVAAVFKLQKIANISDKHIKAYVKYMQEKGKSASTVKTDLAAIRYFYDQIPGAKGFICDNTALELQKRNWGGVDRTWAKDEFIGMIKIASELKQDRIVYVLCLGRYQGLRIHEALRLDYAAAVNALKSGLLHVKGKNGRERDIPLRPQIRRMFTKILKDIPQGEKLFIRPVEKTHLVIKQVQNFIIRHRKKVSNPIRQVNMTFHGLRHTYAAEEYEWRINKGYLEYKARKEVSVLLGHNREDITHMYTFAVEIQLKDRKELYYGK